MKKLLFIISTFLSLASLSAQEITIDQLRAKYLAALGYERASSIQSVKVSGKMTQGGAEFKLVSFDMRPNLGRMEMELQGSLVIIVSDDKSAWMINPFTGSTGPQDMAPEMVAAMNKESKSDPYAYWDNSFACPKDSGIKMELAGKEDYNGTPVYKVKAVFTGDYHIDYYLDADKFIVLKTNTQMKAQGQVFDQETRYSDFRLVENILVPFHIMTFVNGQEQANAVVEQCEFNIPMEEGLFKKPAKE
jgi:outer membrane lipoprotein-sorting protein